MEFREVVEKRRSVRRFTDELVSHEVLEDIVSVARYSPSWKNTQTVRYIVIEDKAIIEKIANDCVIDFEYNKNTLLKSNQMVIIATVAGRCGYERDGSFTTSKKEGWEMFDAGIAAQTFCLAAAEKGVGTCIMGIFDPEKVGEAISIPEGQIVSAIIPIGYPKFEPDKTPRKEVEALISYR